MVDEVLYFGYGANRDPKMIGAIIGRIPQGYSSSVSGFELYIQTWKEIPDSIKQILMPAWDEKFATYFICPLKDSTKKVAGTLWKITRKERKLMDFWEIMPRWYNALILEYTADNGINKQLEIPVITSASGCRKVDGLKYRTFLNSPRMMYDVARNVSNSVLKIMSNKDTEEFLSV